MTLLTSSFPTTDLRVEFHVYFLSHSLSQTLTLTHIHLHTLTISLASTHKSKQTQTERQTDTATHTNCLTQAQTHSQAHTDTDMTQTHSHTYCTHWTLKLIWNHVSAHTHTHTHTLSLSLSLLLSPSLVFNIQLGPTILIWKGTLMYLKLFFSFNTFIAFHLTDSFSRHNNILKSFFSLKE